MESADYTRRAAVHRRAEVATSRPEYRNTRKRETAVKVYTINQESRSISFIFYTFVAYECGDRYLIVQKVQLGCSKELLDLFSLYGPIEEYAN